MLLSLLYEVHTALLNTKCLQKNKKTEVNIPPAPEKITTVSNSVRPGITQANEFMLYKQVKPFTGWQVL